MEQTMPTENGSQQMAKADERSVQTTREAQRYLTPPVDIYETAESLIAVADLPGVKKEALSVHVDQGVLTIDGRVSHPLPENLVHGEFELLPFHRQFQLSEAVDQAKITAELKNGVLTVRLPKAEEVKPKAIQVQIK